MQEKSSLSPLRLFMIYDLFQQKAIDYIKNGYSVIVSAPTGAGKTVIAEYVINDCLEKNRMTVNKIYDTYIAGNRLVCALLKITIVLLKYFPLTV